MNRQVRIIITFIPLLFIVETTIRPLYAETPLSWQDCVREALTMDQAKALVMQLFNRLQEVSGEL